MTHGHAQSRAALAQAAPLSLPHFRQLDLLGSGYADLTLSTPSSSISLSSGCMWHGYVTSGEVTEA
jgi:hypothetical protein